MKVNEKIRIMRETNDWTQKEMANKLNMPEDIYAKLESGDDKIYINQLNKILQVFDVDITDLLSLDKQGLIFLINDVKDTAGDSTNNNHITYYGQTDETQNEIEKLKLIITHKDEIIAQKEQLISRQQQQIDTLNNLVQALQKQSKH